MKKYILGALLLLTLPLQAVLVPSELGMTGIGTPDSNLGTASSLGSMSQRRTHTTEGVFEGITVGSSFTMNPLNLSDDPFTPYVLWSVLHNGDLFEFTLESTEKEVISNSRGFLLFLSGTGFITTNGLNPSRANYAFSTQQAMGEGLPEVRPLTWSSSTTSNVKVPDTGIGFAGFLATMWSMRIIRRLC